MKIIKIGCILLLSFVALLVIEAFIVSRVKLAPFSNPSQVQQNFGNTGKSITYILMGDSTSAGQGAKYEKGIAIGTSKYLATSRNVTMVNLGISGATVEDVLTDQLPKALKVQPDLVLLSVGANDITRLTGLSSLKKNLNSIIDQLIANNCDVKIVVTGSPDMGSIELFPQPLRYIAGLQSMRVNTAFEEKIKQKKVTYAPIAKETGSVFRNDVSLFASDKFHPNDKGYAVWLLVLNNALENALRTQPTHCT